MMVGNNLSDVQLQQLVDRTIIKADKDFDGKISFDEFCEVSAIFIASSLFKGKHPVQVKLHINSQQFNTSSIQEYSYMTAHALKS